MMLSNLKKDDGRFRLQIDSYLIASWVNPIQINPHLVLNLNDTYHYHNLPDLTMYLRVALSKNNWNESLIAGYLSVFCLQIKKHKRTISNSKPHEQAAIVNMMHGTLLGLYPYNVRHLTFEQRVHIAGELRRVLTSDNIQAFLNDNENLIQLCIIEYLVNVICDFCPVEEQIFFKHTQARFSINQIYENFRSNITSMQTICFYELNNMASIQLTTVFRQLKSNITKLSRKQHVIRIPAQIMQTLSNHSIFEKIMQLPKICYVENNWIAQIKTFCPYMSFDELQSVEFIWTNVHVTNLPQILVDAQRQHLRKYGSCTILTQRLQHMAVCLPCALKSKNDILKQQFAFNCVTSKLQCATCSQNAYMVNMMGRALCIRNKVYYMCAGCLQFTTWHGQSCFQCDQCTIEAKPEPCVTCIACKRKSLEVIHKVLDVDNLVIIDTPLCYQHAKPSIMSKNTIYDIKMLSEELYGTHAND